MITRKLHEKTDSKGNYLFNRKKEKQLETVCYRMSKKKRETEQKRNKRREGAEEKDLTRQSDFSGFVIKGKSQYELASASTTSGLRFKIKIC